MIRKDFIKFAAMAGGYYATTGKIAESISPVKNNMEGIKASDLQNFLVSLTKLKEKTVDRIIIGDPSTKIKKIGTLLDALP